MLLLRCIMIYLSNSWGTKDFVPLTDYLFYKFKKMTKLDELIESNNLENQNRKNRLGDKLRQEENYGDKEELFDPVTKTLISNGEAWRAHSQTMQALQNRTLTALARNTNALKSVE